MVYCKIYVIQLTFLCQYLVHYEYPSLFIVYLTFSYRHIHRSLNPTRNCRLCSFTRYTSRMYLQLSTHPSLCPSCYSASFYYLHSLHFSTFTRYVYACKHQTRNYKLSSFTENTSRYPPILSCYECIHFSLLHCPILFHMYILYMQCNFSYYKCQIILEIQEIYLHNTQISCLISFILHI